MGISQRRREEEEEEDARAAERDRESKGTDKVASVSFHGVAGKKNGDGGTRVPLTEKKKGAAPSLNLAPED